MNDTPASSFGQETDAQAIVSGVKPLTIYDDSTQKELRKVGFFHNFTISKCLHYTWEAEETFLQATGAERATGPGGRLVIVHHATDSQEWLFVEQVAGGFAVSIVTVPPAGPMASQLALWTPLETVEADTVGIDLYPRV